MFRALIESSTRRRAALIGCLAGFAVAAGIAPAAAQPPSSVDLNLGILSETGAIGPYRPGGSPYAPGFPGTRPYGTPDYSGRPPERPLQHLPRRPTSDWTR
jgi:hypothetical protein